MQPPSSPFAALDVEAGIAQREMMVLSSTRKEIVIVRAQGVLAYLEPFEGLTSRRPFTKEGLPYFPHAGFSSTAAVVAQLDVLRGCTAARHMTHVSMGRKLAAGDGDGGDEVTAFLITLGAGLATTVGAALAFCLPVERNWIFAACLAVSAGVMTQVSYQEIFSKAEEEFLAEGFEKADAFTLATLVFFGGIIVSAGLEFVSHAVLKKDCCDPDAPAPTSNEQSAEQPPEGAVEAPPSKEGAKDKAEMVQMAAFSGLAVALHNFPEGLATFVATLADPKFGATLGLAIAIHNIPEGLAVAVPVLKATGSKTQAFLWAFLSGVFEPLGGLLGWLVLKEVIGPISYAILFGIIGGVMVHISFRKLLPTALRYDPKNEVTSYAFFLGMALMSASLVAFSY